MTLGDLIQNIAAGSAVFLGITYVIGGLIVNLNLSRRGVKAGETGWLTSNMKS